MNELNTSWHNWNKTHRCVCGPVIHERSLEGESTTYVFLFPKNNVADRICLQKGYLEREQKFKELFKRQGWEWE